MKAYVTTTGIIFGVVALAHIWRAVEEGPGLLKSPWWVLITLVAAALSIWAWRLLRASPRP
jgi:hypothetical protein